MSEEKADKLIAEIKKFAKEKRYEILPLNELPTGWTLTEYTIYREICFNELYNLNISE